MSVSGLNGLIWLQGGAGMTVPSGLYENGGHSPVDGPKNGRGLTPPPL